MNGERLWGYERPLPVQLQIAVNINIVGFDQKGDSTLDAPFVFTVNYAPSVAQMSVRGHAQVQGDVEEIRKLVEEHKQNKPPPSTIIQAVSSIAMAESILMSKSLGVPPPLPQLGGAPDQPGAPPAQPRRPESRYT